jgi:hypothetical protein
MTNSGNFKDGNKKGKGRPKGSPNKTTAEIRAAFKILLNNNLDDIQKHLDIVAAESSIEYIKLILKLTVYSLPTLNSVQDILLLYPATYKFDVQ